eukprot:245255_1
MASLAQRLGKSHFTEDEAEFMAEDEQITIYPNFTRDVLMFVSHDCGPFRPNIPVEVPLWLAVKLKKLKKCTIQIPDWLDKESLQDHLNRERNNPKAFEWIHYHYIEISKLLFQHALSDIADCDAVRSLLRSIQECREEKIRVGLKQIQASTTSISLNNIAYMELNTIRTFVCHAMDKFSLLGRSIVDGEMSQSTQPSYSAPTASSDFSPPDEDSQPQKLRRFNQP